ncbi:hypothetical protein C3V36_08750 [Lachnospiraceae bacterium oral taxon 500]|nr:hypothetical protein C3V36_08750 [Lachnospiraceae bacterium oral taxon 500]
MKRAWGYQSIFKYFILLSCLPLIIISIGVFLVTNYTIRERLLEEQIRIVENQNYRFHEQITQLELEFRYFGYELQKKVSEIQSVDYENSRRINEVAGSLFYFTNSNLLVTSAEALLTGIEQNDFYAAIGEQGSFYKKREGEYALFDQGIAAGGWLEYSGQIYFVQKLNVNSYLQVKLNIAELKKLLFSESENSYTAFLFDGQKIISSDDGADRYDSLTDSAAAQAFNQKNRGRHAVLNTGRHLLSEWKILTVLDMESAFRPLILYFKIVFFMILGLLLVMLAIEGLLYTRFSGYVKTILRSMFGSDELGQTGELELMQAKWTSIVQDKSSLQGELLTKNQRLISSLLQQLVNGRSSRYIDSIAKEIEKLGFPAAEGFQILNLTLTEQIGRPGTHVFAGEGLQPLSEALQPILAELLPETEYFILAQGHYSVFILIAGQTKKLAQERLAERINTALNRYVTVISHDKKVQLNELYEEAATLLAYRTYQKLILANQFIEVSSFDPAKLEYHPSIADVYLNSLLSAFESEDLKTIEVQYFRWIESLAENYRYQFMIMQEVQVFYEKLKLLLRTNKLNLTELEDYYDISRSLIGQVSIESIGDMIWERLLIPCYSLYAEEKGQRIENSVQLLIENINQNYQDQYLSLDQQADELNIPVANLSRWFKNVVGVSYIDYLTKIRMEQAVKLLITTEEPVKQVAVRVGYEPTYFSRIFKKQYGVTPGTYRQENQSAE